MYTIQKAKVRLEREEKPPVNLYKQPEGIMQELDWLNNNA